MTDRSLKYSFADIAGEYHAIRPGYPDDLYQTLTADCKLSSTTEALEIGCGTGQATVKLAGLVGPLHCIDLGDDQIHIARETLKENSNVSFEVLAFEDLDFSEERFDLVFCAQAFHWLDPQKRFKDTAQILRPGGHLALVWNVDRAVSHPLQQSIDDSYKMIAPLEPDYTERQRIFIKDIEDTKKQMAQCGFFSNVSSRTYDNPITYDACSYIRLISTYAYLSTLENGARQRLFGAIAHAVEKAGGEITVFHQTRLIAGRKGPA